MRLTQEQVNFYRINGYIHLKGVLSDKEIEELYNEYNRLFAFKNNNGMEAAWATDEVKKAAENTEYSVHSIHNLQFHSGVFSKFLHNENMLEALEDIMETPNILLHHTKAHWKPAKNGAPYLMHQDYHYFPFEKHSMVAMILHLDDSSPENGGLCVYPGSHKNGPLQDFGTFNPETKQSYHYQDPKKYPIEGATPLIAKRGDIVVFSYLLLHGSYRNLSDRPRRIFLTQLMAAEDTPTNEDHKSPGQGWVLRGRNDKRKATFSERFLH